MITALCIAVQKCIELFRSNLLMSIVCLIYVGVIYKYN